jgi:hypothetical protein
LSTTGAANSSASSISAGTVLGLRPRESAMMIGACALTSSSAALRSASGLACIAAGAE